MNTRELAKKLAQEHKTIQAEKYDLFLRDYDNMVELIGLVQDPNYSMNDFRGREMLFPKRWLTLTVLDAETVVNV
jgi:hypothetical protein